MNADNETIPQKSAGSHPAAHTPGPWVTDRTRDEGKLAVRAADSQFAICTFAAFVNNHEANARLCAAAPDLLEALKGLLLVIEATAERGVPRSEVEVAERAARQAIKRAEGGQ